MNPDRRRTLASSGPPSSLPVPSSIPRPASSLRQSLAPPQTTSATLRQSLAPSASSRARGSIAFPSTGGASQNPGAESQGSQGTQLFSQGHGGPTPSAASREAPATVGRNNNIYSSHGSTSVNRVGTLKSGPLDYPPSERRQSAFRRSTMGTSVSTPVGAHGPLHSNLPRPQKDPRDSRSSENKKRWAADIVAFLNARNFIGPGNAGPATEKQLLQPTGPQFYSFFRFLVLCVDPNSRFGQGKKVEDDVVPTLVLLGYPFATSITKSHLQSIGSQQSWPNMLAMLHWLVVTVEQREGAFDSAAHLHIPVPDEDLPYEELVFAAWLEFASQSYPAFLVTPEEQEFEADQELDIFHSLIEGGRARLRARVEDLEIEGEELQKEWDALEQNPDPLIALDDKVTKSENDKVKMVTYCSELQKRIGTKKADTKHHLALKEQSLKERSEREAQIRQLTTAVQSQGMTPTEIQHLSTEKAQLQAAQRAVNAKQTAKLEAGMSLEIALQKRIDRASALCAQYTTKAEALGLLPRAPDGFEHVQFEQELNGAAENPVPDCLTTVKPALTELRARAKAAYNKTNGEDIVLEERITRVNEAIAELREQAEADEVALDQADRENAEFKESATVEFTSVAQELDRLTGSVNQIASTLGHTLTAAEFRFDQRVKERAQAVEDTDRVRRETREALEVALEDIISYKAHMMEQSDLLLRLAIEGGEA